jgi:hypothetical protein
MDFNGYDALYYCVKYASLKSLKKLISRCYQQIYFDRTYGKKKRNILTIAALYGDDMDILRYLLKNSFIRFNPN